jgi:hypothetical protein
MAPHISAYILGASKVLDIANTIRSYHVRKITLDDAEALRDDWAVVGRDIKSALDATEEDYERNRR